MQDENTNESHKTNAQINHTNESHEMGHRCDDIMTKIGKSQMMLSDAPEQLRCLFRHLKLLI